MIEIVDAIDAGNIVRKISQEEEESILPNNRGGIKAQRLMQRLKESKHYLHCHCVSPAAVMFTQHHKSGYRLVCHSKLGVHDRNCAHFRDIQGWVVNNPKDAEYAIRRQQATYQNFSLFGPFAGPKQKSQKSKGKQQNPTRKSGKKTPKITNLINYLIKKSENNVIQTNKKITTQQEAFQNIKQAAKNTKFGDGNLSDWIFFGNKCFGEARLALEKIRDNGKWIHAGRPHAFLIEVVDKAVIHDEDISKKHIKLDNWDYYYERLITEGQGIKTEGPYLVFMAMCEIVENGKFRVHTIYIKPIVYNNVLMPVDSNYERKFVRRVIYALKKDADWKLTKPIDGKVVNNSFLLPDFLVENNKKKVFHILEIMGMLHDQDYVDRKDYIIPLMIDAWPYHEMFEIDPTHSSSDIGNYLKKIDRIVEFS